MIIEKAQNVEGIKVESIGYKEQMKSVKDVTVQWLSKTGEDEAGYPEYGLRLFTIGPSGEIPIHSHFYIQTMYILSGEFECWQFDPETDEIVDTKTCGPGDSVYIASMEPHGMKNLSSTEAGTFLCCICNLYTDKGL